jgi:hypothetical protein
MGNVRYPGAARARIAIPTERSNVRYWPKADMLKNAIDVAIGVKADMPFYTAHVCF